MDGAEVNGDDVCTLSCLKRAYNISHVQRSCTHNRGHFQCLPRWKSCRIIASGLRHKSSEARFLKHIQVVITCGSVGSNADIEPICQHGLDWRNATGKLQITRRIVSHTCVVV